MLTALVTGNMIGSGIFLLPSALAKIGSISILAWLFTATGAMLLALVFARLSRILPGVGGPYAFCRAAYGDFIGFSVAYNYWVALWVGNAAITVALISYLSFFWPELRANNLLAFLASIGLVWFATLINLIGVRQAGMVQVITTILKLLPLLLIAFVGLFFVNTEYLAEFNISGESNLSAFSIAAALTLWSFIGLESATVPTKNIEHPEKVIPRATLLGTGIAAIVYILSTIAIMGIIPLSQLTQSTSPYADAAQFIFGNWGARMVAIGAIISCFGALNGWTLLQGQVPMAAALDQMMPRIFAKQNRNGTPVYGLLITSMLITLLLSMSFRKTLVEKFELIILLATMASLLPYLLTSMAELLITLKEKMPITHPQIFKLIILSVLTFAYTYWAIAGTGMEIVFYGCLLFFSSVPIYVWMKWRNSKENPLAL